ncbi:hypothetical protein A9K55_000346 [Cordyceps militaris]|uniref:Uncharacterized protein n=1 Tax=Cordyceps militaris TaxID=73501 RepID=A0A2H4SVW5_CORMI|nr:hypothetical protein A9K55_000346 [Cordyceps militaris]
MGFLAFLQRRQSDKTSLSSSPSTATLQRTNTPSTATKIRSRSVADLLGSQHTYHPQHAHQRSDSRTATPQPTQWTIPDFSQQRATSSQSHILLSPKTSGKRAGAPAVLGRHVDLLDAQGQLGPSDFKARLQAAGSREYGEDVAERNIGQNGLLLGSPAVQRFYATRSLHVSQRRHTSAPKVRKYAPADVIHEQPEYEDAAHRPSSPSSSIYTARSMPITRARVTSIFDSPVYTEQSPRTGRRASVATLSYIGRPQRQQSTGREETDTEESDDAFPPSIPRFRRSEPESSTERPVSVLGSVRRARQSADVLSAYNMGAPSQRTLLDKVHNCNDGGARPASRESCRSPAALLARPVSIRATLQPRPNLSVENMLRWRQTLGDDEADDDADQRSLATERATESRASQRQWSVTSTEPTERSDVSSVCPRPASRATVTTSVDMRSLLDLDEHCPEEENDDDCSSITTDGSNVDAFVAKRQRRAAPEDKALLFKESQFFIGTRALPGLFDDNDATPVPRAQDPLNAQLQQPQQDEAPAAPRHSRRQETRTPPPLDMLIPEDARPMSRLGESPIGPEAASGGWRGLEEPAAEDESSVTATPESTPGPFIPRMYLNQRQRLLALGFDYDTDEEDTDLTSLSDEDDGADVMTLKARVAAAPVLRPQRLSVIVEAPSGDDSAVRWQRNDAKRITPRGAARRVDAPLEEEGNLADVEY